MKNKELSLFTRFIVTNTDTDKHVAHGICFFEMKVVVYYSDSDYMAIYNSMDFLYAVYPTTSKYKITFLDSNIIPNTLFN